MAIMVKLGELRNAINRERVALLSELVGNAAAQASFGRQLDAERDTVRTLLDDLASRKDADPAFAGGFARLLAAHHDYSAVRDNEVLELFRAGQHAASVEAATGRLQGKFDLFKSVAEQIAKQQIGQAQARMNDSAALVDSAVTRLVVLNLA